MSFATVPVFAADTGQDEFAAVKSMGSDVTPLSDEQLASIEGGDHVTTAQAGLALVADIMGDTNPFNNVFAAGIQQQVIDILTATAPHNCLPTFAGAC